MTDLNTKSGTYSRLEAAKFFSLVFVVATICLWPNLGNTAAYLALIAAVPALLLAAGKQNFRAIVSAKWVWMLVTAFILLSLAFLLQPGQSSVPAIGDFAIFAVAPLLGLAVLPFGKRASVASLSWIFFLSVFLCSWVGIAGAIEGQDRASNAELSPIHFANLALLTGFAALTATFNREKRWTWIFYCAPLLGLVAAIASNTRSALVVALVLALLYAVFWLRERTWPGFAKLALLLGVLVATMFSFFAAQWFGFSRPLSAIDPILAIFRGELPADLSSSYRVEMYVSGFMAFWDAPLYGHGWHSQLQAALPYMSSAGIEGYAREAWGYIHNDFLSFAVAAGFLGALAYVILLLAPIVAAVEADGKITFGPRLYLATTLSIGLLVGGATDVLFMVEVPKLLLVVTCALIFAALPEGGADQE